MVLRCPVVMCEMTMLAVFHIRNKSITPIILRQLYLLTLSPSPPPSSSGAFSVPVVLGWLHDAGRRLLNRNIRHRVARPLAARVACIQPRLCAHSTAAIFCASRRFPPLSCRLLRVWVVRQTSGDYDSRGCFKTKFRYSLSGMGERRPIGG